MIAGAERLAIRLETVEHLAAAAPWHEVRAWLDGVRGLLLVASADLSEERGLDRARQAGWLAEPAPVAALPEEPARAAPEVAAAPEQPPAPPPEAAVTEAPAAPREAPAPASATTSIQTPERSALLRKLWPDPALSVGQIQHRLNALPGKPIQTPPALYGWAKSLGLPTARTGQPGFAAAALPPIAAKSAPAPAPAKPPAPARNREEQVAEARRLRKEGHAPEAIARRTDLPMDDVRALQAAAEQTAREMIELGSDTDQVVIEAGLPPARVRALRDEMRAAKRAPIAT